MPVGYPELGKIIGLLLCCVAHIIINEKNKIKQPPVNKAFEAFQIAQTIRNSV